MSPEFILQICFAVIGALALSIFKGLAEDVKRLREGVSELNAKIAVIIQRIDSHERRISDLEES